MILVGNQRGGAKDLALHLLKQENDHVQVHELRGFASDNLHSALNESYAISRGTRCKQHLFSLSINPPPDKQVSTEEFEQVIGRAEERLGLTGQPRAIVFHEKEGRRHAHAVWSRINAEEMKAVHLPHTKRKLTALTRDIFIERQWHMPRGLMASEERDVRSFSMEEWQHAKRAKIDRGATKTALQDCWAVSDSRGAFEQALQSRGFKLARGDRRAFVAVDQHGEVYALPRWIGVKTRDVRARLGEMPDGYSTVEKRKQEFATQIDQRLRELHEQERRAAEAERERREAERRALVERQRVEREMQATAIKARWDREMVERQQRFSRGIRGLIDRISGRYARIRDQNINETNDAMRRDRAEKDALIFRHLGERRTLDQQRHDALRSMIERQRELEADLRRLRPAIQEPERAAQSPGRDHHHSRRAEPPGQVVREADRTDRAADPQPDREARREEFMRQRQEQAARQARNRGPGLGR
jgi:hypothetical protein